LLLWSPIPPRVSYLAIKDLFIFQRPCGASAPFAYTLNILWQINFRSS